MDTIKLMSHIGPATIDPSPSQPSNWDHPTNHVFLQCFGQGSLWYSWLKASTTASRAFFGQWKAPSSVADVAERPGCRHKATWTALGTWRTKALVNEESALVTVLVCVSLGLSLSVSLSLSLYMCIYIYINMCVCIYTYNCIYIYVYVCMRI